MKRHPKYFYSLLTVFIIPTFIFGFLVREEFTFLKLFVFASIVMIVGAIWDTWATRHGWRDSFWLWTFNKKYLLGPRYFGIPIEEYGFFFFGATFTVTLWELISKCQLIPSKQNLLVLIVIFLWLFAAVTLPKLKDPD